MATWTLSANAFLIFAGRNLLTQDAIDYGTFTASEMQALISRVIDGDPYSFWQGSTAVDGTSVTLNFTLNQGSAIVAQNFDLVCLQNINWKNFKVESSTDGITYNIIQGLDYQNGVANNSLTDLIVNITSGATGTGIKYIRVTITHTITANEKKKCGGIIICLGKLQLSSGFLNYKTKYRETFREIELGDRTISREYIRRSAADYEFWGAAFDCPVVTAAELSTLRELKRGGDPFILIPEPNDTPRDVYLCHFDGPWEHKYENPVRSVGFLIPIKVKEVGSH